MRWKNRQVLTLMFLEIKIRDLYLKFKSTNVLTNWYQENSAASYNNGLHQSQPKWTTIRYSKGSSTELQQFSQKGIFASQQGRLTGRPTDSRPSS